MESTPEARLNRHRRPDGIETGGQMESRPARIDARDPTPEVEWNRHRMQPTPDATDTGCNRHRMKPTPDGTDPERIDPGENQRRMESTPDGIDSFGGGNRLVWQRHSTPEGTDAGIRLQNLMDS
ncbi:hypothetical protein BJ508DRAFT_305794 [Ascobolus immersus RN42]|uniref:Uncharacterized protein n=1 Tax=Ascobolus immersus RN42 TaxID=1160509 RepID=A0A3N4I8J3_ASCIM|nr:hypothetical protein BJ508DRAFT_305794 [Ascobolus immersus RN42]